MTSRVIAEIGKSTVNVAKFPRNLHIHLFEHYHEIFQLAYVIFRIFYLFMGQNL